MISNTRLKGRIFTKDTLMSLIKCYYKNIDVYDSGKYLRFTIGTQEYIIVYETRRYDVNLVKVIIVLIGGVDYGN